MRRKETFPVKQSLQSSDTREFQAEEQEVRSPAGVPEMARKGLCGKYNEGSRGREGVGGVSRLTVRAQASTVGATPLEGLHRTVTRAGCSAGNRLCGRRRQKQTHLPAWRGEGSEGERDQCSGGQRPGSQHLLAGLL